MEAYKNFIDDPKNLVHLKKQVNNIIIVNKNARKYDDFSASSTPLNLGYWVEGDIGSNKLATSTLFLSIDSYKVTGSDYDNTNKLLHDFIVKYDAIANTIHKNDHPTSTYATSEVTGTHSSGNGLFNTNNFIVNGVTVTDYITGIVLTKTAEGIPIVKRKIDNSNSKNDFDLSVIDNTKIVENDINDVLLKRDERLLKNFLNMIVNLDLVNRRTQIKGMLTYFKIIKEYLYIAITTGNLLFNSYYNTINISAPNEPASNEFTNRTLLNTTSGYAIKYLTKSDILSESNSIYKLNQTTGGDDAETIVTTATSAASATTVQ